MMRAATCTIVLALGVVTILALPGEAVASSPGRVEAYVSASRSRGASHSLRWSRLRPGSRVICSRAVFKGSLTVSVYSLKGSHPSAGARRCSRAEAVVNADLDDLYSGRQRPLGKSFDVQGITYTLEGVAGRGASDLTTAFVGAGTAVLAQLTSL